MNLGATLKQKYAGVPVYVWALLGTAALALFLINRRNKQPKSDQAAANSVNSNLGSASALQNLFAEAFPMNYMGGDVYVNQVVNPQPTTPPATTPPPPDKAKPPVGLPGGIKRPATPIADSNPYVYRVKSGDSWSKIASMFGMSVADLKAFNMGTGYGAAGRPASTIAILKQRGDTLYRNEEIDIPHKGTIYSGTGGA